MGKQLGKIVKIGDDGNFGFIRCADGTERYFCRHDLTPTYPLPIMGRERINLYGRKVRFDLGIAKKPRKAPPAVNVELI